MVHSALFGERSLTLVAALFPDQGRAAESARRLSGHGRGLEEHDDVAVLHPSDTDVARRLEPDTAGIWRTALRSHAWLGAGGLALGLLAAGALVVAGWPAAVTSPRLSALFLGVLGAFFGMLIAGLLTLRPDHGRVIQRVRAGLRRGQYAVVAHPRDERQAHDCAALLREDGGEVIRSL